MHLCSSMGSLMFSWKLIFYVFTNFSLPLVLSGSRTWQTHAWPVMMHLCWKCSSMFSLMFSCKLFFNVFLEIVLLCFHKLFSAFSSQWASACWCRSSTGFHCPSWTPPPSISSREKKYEIHKHIKITKTHKMYSTIIEEKLKCKTQSCNGFSYFVL